jgi:TPR repeat protein
MKKTLFILSILTTFSFSGDFQDAMNAYNNKNYKKAVKLLTSSSNQGHSSAHSNLGHMYKNGLGVKQNYKKAIELYTLSANQGHSSAQSNLGLMYYLGNGIKKNKIKAYQLWLKLAKQGHSNSQHNLDILCKQSPWACKE